MLSAKARTLKDLSCGALGERLLATLYVANTTGAICASYYYGTTNHSIFSRGVFPNLALELLIY